ncbi:MAG: RNA degradosome polyphosphate kinase, partial [Actinobacteria bacterium]|nr:RNA degradosome polyphosphate kinase [Actinomycetota bacterium]
VVVLVEITARFDEQANIRWARALEKAGCHVVYGLVGLKTHCKTSLVVRQEKGQLRRYAHIGTGNYNPKTARIYEDFGLLTADAEVGADLTDLFNTLTGYSRQTRYRTLMVAPHGVRAGLVERIEQQGELARAGRPSRIRLKANSIVDESVIDTLYRASRDGVPIELVVRGICALRPGVPGLSDTISVRSIVGRFLEHSRLMVFGDTAEGGQAEHWLGSADLMHRNLDRRVETLVRVKDPGVQGQIDAILDRAMAPSTRHWSLQQDGCWQSRPEQGEPSRDMQTDLMRRTNERGASD